jgi:hypothetical protein
MNGGVNQVLGDPKVSVVVDPDFSNDVGGLRVANQAVTQENFT